MENSMWMPQTCLRVDQSANLGRTCKTYFLKTTRKAFSNKHNAKIGGNCRIIQEKDFGVGCWCRRCFKCIFVQNARKSDSQVCFARIIILKGQCQIQRMESNKCLCLKLNLCKGLRLFKPNSNYFLLGSYFSLTGVLLKQ